MVRPRPTAVGRSQPTVHGRVGSSGSSSLIASNQVRRATIISRATVDRPRKRNLTNFLSIKKTTKTDIGASSLQPDDEESVDDEFYDRQEVMLAHMCSRFMPDQGSSGGGGGTLYGPHIEDNLVLSVGDIRIWSRPIVLHLLFMRHVFGIVFYALGHQIRRPRRWRQAHGDEDLPRLTFDFHEARGSQYRIGAML
ncbi:hypothetical protein M9H77_07174 [Catharanthus roseus]|uniref:Uncharacterized protein n=1 Tax=Catharanthus roseus TaxID=4058 RepID=A0ACC0BUC9_CATRO|nr:hypothetical protein M9H77_07174 [Catharanthus roseus]